MAKRITGTGTGRTRQQGELAFDDVPERLRPSGFRYWLDRVPQQPDHSNSDHVIAAFGEDIDGARLLVAHHAPRQPPADPHWRTQIAAAEQWEAYVAWCTEQELAGSRGAVPRAWSWTALRRWEDAR